MGRAWAVLMFAGVLGAYAFTAAPETTWLDAPEFATAAVTLGIAHPPGHPLPSLLGRLAGYLPAGDLAFRVNLASALAAAAAAMALALAAAAVVRRLAPDGPARLAGAAAGLGYAFSRAAWEQAARAEVYALESALVLGALACLLASDLGRDRRGLQAAALALGLALANHHFVTLVFLVPAAAAVLLGRPTLAVAGRTAAFGVLGLGAFLYLPLRAAHDGLGWGDPDRLAPFVWTVSARAFQKALGAALPPFGERAADVATALTVDATLPVVALALAGAYALARSRAGATLVLLGGALLLGAGARALLGFDPDNPDARGYLLPALGALFVLGAAGLGFIARLAPRAGRVAAAVALLALPAAQIVRAAPDASLRGARAAEAYGRALLGAVPPRAIVLTSYFETTFQLRAQQLLYGERPDVAVIDRKLLNHPYAPAAAKRRLPELAGFIDARLEGKTGGRPVRFELAPDLEGDPSLFLVPLGLDGALATDCPADRHGADRVLAYLDYLEARLHCAGGRREAARAAYARARARATAGDSLLAELARTCDLD